MWKEERPSDIYTVRKVCDRDWHTQPCYVVSGQFVNIAHLGPTYYANAIWKYKSPCMFTREAKDNAK